MLTGASEFPYVLRVASFLAVSDSPISLDKQRWEASLGAYRIDGKPVFDLTDGNQRRRMLEVLSLAATVGHPDGSEPMRLESAKSLRHRLKGARIITDDNMGTEWM